MLAPALAAVIAAGEGRKEGSVLLYSIRSAGTSYLPSEEEWRGRDAGI